MADKLEDTHALPLGVKHLAHVCVDAPGCAHVGGAAAAVEGGRRGQLEFVSVVKPVTDAGVERIVGRSTWFVRLHLYGGQAEPQAGPRVLRRGCCDACSSQHGRPSGGPRRGTAAACCNKHARSLVVGPRIIDGKGLMEAVLGRGDGGLTTMRQARTEHKRGDDDASRRHVVQRNQ